VVKEKRGSLFVFGTLTVFASFCHRSTHQPKFRGFTVGRKSEVNSAEDATVPQTTTVTTLRHEIRSAELQTTVPEVSQHPPPLTVDRASSGFNERYQERLKSRFRGAGYVSAKSSMFMLGTSMTFLLLVFMPASS
jgi:hypothetical protein